MKKNKKNTNTKINTFLITLFLLSIFFLAYNISGNKVFGSGTDKNWEITDEHIEGIFGEANFDNLMKTKYVEKYKEKEVLYDEYRKEYTDLIITMIGFPQFLFYRQIENLCGRETMLSGIIKYNEKEDSVDENNQYFRNRGLIAMGKSSSTKDDDKNDQLFFMF